MCAPIQFCQTIPWSISDPIQFCQTIPWSISDPLINPLSIHSADLHRLYAKSFQWPNGYHVYPPSDAPNASPTPQVLISNHIWSRCHRVSHASIPFIHSRFSPSLLALFSSTMACSLLVQGLHCKGGTTSICMALCFFYSHSFWLQLLQTYLNKPLFVEFFKSSHVATCYGIPNALCCQS